MSSSSRFLFRMAALLTVLLFIIYYLSKSTSKYAPKNSAIFVFVNKAIQTIGIGLKMSSTTSTTSTISMILPSTTPPPILSSTTSKPISSSTTPPPISSTTTRDEAGTLEERAPISSHNNSNISQVNLAIFVFHTSHSMLIKLQLYLIRKLAIDLIAVELFMDGYGSKEIYDIASLHRTRLHVFPPQLHSKTAGPSDRNADVVNWALATRAKNFLANGTAVLLLDGDVLPISFFSSRTLLNSRDIVCRKHPAPFSRYCWIGFICLAPQIFSTIHDFNVSPFIRQGGFYDSGGRTIDYLVKYRNISFSWMKETILLKPDKTLFWGAVDTDIRWINSGGHFDSCDKCGPEIFLSANNNDDVIFYHMLSASSKWRFADPEERIQTLYNSFMKSPYGKKRELPTSKLINSIKRVQKMHMIPFHGNLSCARVCSGEMEANKT